MKQNITELIEIGRPVFDRIKQAIMDYNECEFYRLLDSEQPDEWIGQLESEFRDENNSVVYYNINTISLLNAVVNEVFTRVTTTIEGIPVITSDKSKHSVTTKVIMEFKNSLVTIHKEGIATCYAASLKHLQLATPKSFTMAKKHAIAQLGDLFGKSLNRDIEDKEGGEDALPEETPLDKLKKLIEEKRYKLPRGLLVDAERIINENETASFDKLQTKLNLL